MDQQIEQLLVDRNLEVEFIDHPPAASAEQYSAVLGTQFKQQAKAILVRYKRPGEKGYVVVTVPAHKQVNLDLIGRVINAKTVRMADRASLYKMTGCQFGELHPFASLFGMKLVMDRDLLTEEKVYMNAGRLDRSVVVAPQSIVQVEDPILI